MWFFMNACYVLSFLTLILFAIAGLQGYFHFPVFQAKHAAFALLFTIVYLFTQVLVTFFFVGTGAGIRDCTKEKTLDEKYRRRSLSIKQRVFPPLFLNMLFVIVLFVSGGAVDTNRLPAWAHGLLFDAGFLHFFIVLFREHRAFQETTEIILELSGAQ